MELLAKLLEIFGPAAAQALKNYQDATGQQATDADMAQIMRQHAAEGIAEIDADLMVLRARKVLLGE